MKTSSRSSRPAILTASIAAFLGLVFIPSSGRATVKNYSDAGSSTNWGEAGNWVGGVPANNDDLVFNVATVLNANNFANPPSGTNPFLTNVNSITFGSNEIGRTLAGGALTVGAGGITSNSTVTQGLSFVDTGITLGAGQAWTANTGGLLVTSQVALSGNTLTVAGGGNITLSGIVSGAGGLTKNAAGTLILSGSNTYTGTTSISAGSVQANNGAALGDSAVSLTGGTLNVNGQALTLRSLAGSASTVDNTAVAAATLVLSNATTLTNYSGTVQNTGGALSITKNGSAEFDLGGSNTYTGGTTINAGTLAINNGAALGTGNVTVNNGGTLLGTANLTLTNPSITLQAGSTTAAAAGTTLTLNAASTTFAAVTSGTIIFGNALNTGVVAISGGSGTVDNASTIQVAFGTVRNADGGFFSIATELMASTTVGAGATLDTFGNGTTIQNLLGAGTLTNDGAAAATFRLQAGNFAGMIKDGASVTAVTKTTAGTLVLNASGSNTFTGDFKVNDGTVQLNAAGTEATGQGALIIGDGAGTANSALVQLLQSSEIRDSSSVTINSEGRFDMNALGETILNLTINGGNVVGVPTNGSSSLRLNFALNQTGGTISGGTGATPGLVLAGGAGASNVTATSDAGGNAATINSNVSLSGGQTRTFTVIDGPGAVDLSITGIIQNGFGAASGLIKTGLGNMTISGANTYTGTTTINTGTLLVNGTHIGAGAYTVANGGQLGGSGTISTASNAGVSVAAGARLGNADSLATNLTFNLGTGILDLVSAITGSGTQALAFELGTVGASDRITLSNVSSVLSIGTGALEFSDFAFTTLGGFGAGSYTLFDTNHAINGSLSGNLSGAINGLAATLSLGNGGQDILLTVAPEPTTGALLNGAALLLAAQRRRRREVCPKA